MTMESVGAFQLPTIRLGYGPQNVSHGLSLVGMWNSPRRGILAVVAILWISERVFCGIRIRRNRRVPSIVLRTFR